MGPFKITVWFESRAGGGLRAYSDDVPGLALSRTDGNAALTDVSEMLSLILSERLNAQVHVERLLDIREYLEDGGIVKPLEFSPGPREYVAICR
jgi:hypothetical protein